MQRAILRKVANFVAKRSPRGSLAPYSGVAILGGLTSIGLLSSHPAMAQNSTFHGVQVSPKFNPNSEMAQLIKKSTTKQFKNSAGATVRLGQWVVIPRSKDSYYTYETKELPKLEIKTYSIIFLADTTSDNPKLFSYGVLCDKNQLKPVSYRVFSSRGDRVTREIVNAPWAAPTNNFLQGLMNEVCKLQG